MPDEPQGVTILGGIYEGTVYLRASDVVLSLRMSADDYRREAADTENEMAAGLLNEVARVLQGEADEFDVISMELLTEDIEEQAWQTVEAATEGQPTQHPPADPAP